MQNRKSIIIRKKESQNRVDWLLERLQQIKQLQNNRESRRQIQNLYKRVSHEIIAVDQLYNKDSEWLELNADKSSLGELDSNRQTRLEMLTKLKHNLAFENMLKILFVYYKEQKSKPTSNNKVASIRGTSQLFKTKLEPNIHLHHIAYTINEILTNSPAFDLTDEALVSISEQDISFSETPEVLKAGYANIFKAIPARFVTAVKPPDMIYFSPLLNLLGREREERLAAILMRRASFSDPLHLDEEIPGYFQYG